MGARKRELIRNKKSPPPELAQREPGRVWRPEPTARSRNIKFGLSSNFNPLSILLGKHLPRGVRMKLSVVNPAGETKVFEVGRSEDGLEFYDRSGFTPLEVYDAITEQINKPGELTEGTVDKWRWKLIRD